MTKVPSSLEEMREMAAQIIEQHQVMHGPDGASLCRRRDGAIDGLVYAEAIRAIPATVQPAQVQVKLPSVDRFNLCMEIEDNTATATMQKDEDGYWVRISDYDAILAALEPQPDPRDEVIALAITACRIIDDAVKEGYDTVNGLMMHLLEAVEPARAALAAAEAVQK
jgi:hypothetical protein